MQGARGSWGYCCLSQQGYHRNSSTTKSMGVIHHTDENICCSIPHFLVYEMGLTLTVLRALW